MRIPQQQGSVSSGCSGSAVLRADRTRGSGGGARAIGLTRGRQCQRKIAVGLTVAGTETSGCRQRVNGGLYLFADDIDRPERVPRLGVVLVDGQRFFLQLLGPIEILARVGDGRQVVPGAEV